MALSLSAAVSGCSKLSSPEDTNQDGEVGRIGFNLMLPNGAVIDPISYEISGPTAKSGAVPTAGNGTTFTVTIDRLKAGGGYTITLKGKQSNMAADCFGTAMFSVAANATTNVTIKLSCPGTRKVRDGAVIVNGSVNICAVIDGTSGTPLDVRTWQLVGTARDDDTLPINKLNYMWTAPIGSGTFDNRQLANPIFTCEVDGRVKLTLEASDTDCGDKMDLEILCWKSGMPVAGSGGNTCTGCDACRSCIWQEPACVDRVKRLESSPKRALAEAVVACVRRTKCSFKTGEFAISDCWCGATEFNACLGGSLPPQGDCRAEIEAAGESNHADELALRFTDPDYPLGLAFDQLICEAAVCPPPICAL